MEPAMGKEFWEQLGSYLLPKLIDKVSFKKIKSLFRKLFYSAKRLYKKASKSKNRNIRNYQMEKAPDTSSFAGREQLLDMLENAILKENAALIALYGLGGMGKTTVASYLAEKLKGNFEHVIWQPLQDAPEAEKVFTQFIQFFSCDISQEDPTDMDRQIETLLRYLSNRRCLLIFDNAETVLSEEYPQEGARVYERLLESIMSRKHQSCVLVTSREEPKFVSSKAMPHSRIQCVDLPGLDPAAIQDYLKGWGLEGEETEWLRLVDAYSGNPLLINMAANLIHETYEGRIARFLEKEHFLFGESIISKSIDVLSRDEEAVLRWLSLKSPRNREELEAATANLEAPRVDDTIKMLKNKAMIMQTQEGWIVHNIIMEYLLDKTVGQTVSAIIGKDWKKIRDFAVMEADGPDYAKENQLRKIVKPVLERLYSSQSSWKNVMALLEDTLSEAKGAPLKEQRYAPGSLVNLMISCGREESLSLGNVDRNDRLAGKNLSGYAFWQADFENQALYKTDFTGSHFSRTRFRENIDLPVSCAFSHSGDFFAVGDVKGNLTLWDAKSFVKQEIIHVHERTIYGIAFTDDDRYLVTVSHDRTIKCLEVGTYNEIPFFDSIHVSDGWNCLDVRGDFAAAAGNERKIYLWSRKEKKPKIFSDPSWGTFHVIKIDPGCSFLIAGDSKGQLIKIPLALDAPVQTVKAHDGQLSAAAFCPADGGFLTGGQDGKILLWKQEMSFWPLCFEDAHNGFLTGLVFSKDGTLISTGHDGKIRLWKKQKWSDEFAAVSTLCRHKGSIESIAFSSDDKTLVSCSDDMSLRVWNLKKGICVKKASTYCGWVSSLSFFYHHNDPYLAGGCADGTVKLWNYSSGELSKTFCVLDDRVNPIAINDTEDRIAAGTQNGRILIWDIESEKPIRELKGHSGAVRALIFLKGGTRLISAAYDHTVRYWEINPDNVKYTIISREFPRWLGAAAIDREERWLAYALFDGRIQVLEQQGTWKEICCLETEEKEIQTLAFSDDGRYLASGGSGGSVSLWCSQDWSLCKTVKIEQETPAYHIGWISFSPDGGHLLAGGGQACLKLWNVPDLQEEAFDRSSGQNLHCAIFTKDGKQAVTSGDRGIIDIWELPGLKHLNSIPNRRPYEGMLLKGATGLTEPQRKTLETLGADTGEKTHV